MSYPSDDKLSFHFGTEKIRIFEQWMTDPEWHFMATCLAVFTFSFLYEGLKALNLCVQYAKLDHLKQRSDPPLYAEQNGYGAVPRRPGEDMDMESSCGSYCCLHVLHALLYALQVFAALLMVLIFLTLNLWLCIMLCAGAAMGVLIFSPYPARRLLSINCM
ncbi:high affinity copper uptake protein 1 [Lingula anatina]|uniref:Copper transport protein n=1 Tax=Lingula anatina TaxID=7574 RepID=A0A1S3IPU8_LINAN|nr:high affinity copper uptake protein 1 [Lingula anatina]|eukprot:XP_013400242.1 high affinity copper uptake protein 1 [Lingula anatina]